MSTKPRILVIEDEPRMRRNLATILRMENFESLEAQDGAEGVEVCRRERPDLVLCDISIPKLDGYGVLSALQADPATAGTPFIFLTARGDKGDIRTGMNLGADDYLVKPIEIGDLLSAINARLTRKQLASPPPAKPAEPSAQMLLSLGLTDREAEVLFWLAHGKTNPEICMLLGLQLTTVKKHVANVFQKLRVENRTSAAAIALERFKQP